MSLANIAEPREYAEDSGTASTATSSSSILFQQGAGSGIQFGDSPRGITGSYTVVNTAGIAQATIDLLLGLADEALRLWGTVLAGTANISLQLTIADIANNRGNGTWGTGFSAGSSGGFSIAVGAPAYELALGLNTGGSTDIVITLDPDYIANELFLDPTPATRDDIPVNRTDGLSVFLHEIGHALGFTGYYNEANDTFFSNFKTTYDLRLAISGGNVSFDGPNVQALYGAAVPLTDMNYAHYGNTNAFPGTSTDPLTGLMNGVVFYRGYAYSIKDIDLAFLADTGLGTIRDDILNVPQLVRMRGGPGNDTITGSALNNSLWGDEGNDTIFGGAGNDMLDGGSGINALYGEAGNDRLLVSANGATVDGGSETDTLVIDGTVGSFAAIANIEAIELSAGAAMTLTGTQFANGFSPTSTLSGNGAISVNMDPGVFMLGTNMTVQAGSSIAYTVNGTSGTDIIKSSRTASNTINGGDGADQIRGGNLADTINGGNGDDKLIALGGADTLTGGAGIDQFRFYFAADSGLGPASDHITDFTPGTDKLDFRVLDPDPVAAGRQVLTFIGTQAFHATAGVAEIRYTASGSDMLLEVDLNGDGNADMQIILDGIGAQSLSAGDFLL